MKKFVVFVMNLAFLFANSFPPPSGVRPCCAFGHNLKSKQFGLQVPFFKMENIIDIEHLGIHKYNDGSDNILGQVFDLSDEKNGIIYTKKAGFIDTAHVRDTADWTYYLYINTLKLLGSSKSLTLSTEIRKREIVFPLLEDNFFKSHKQKQAFSAELAGILAFNLAQWHEIAQYFGFKSVVANSEEVSAFSPEDLYSNMLGSWIATYIIKQNPNLNKDEFVKAFNERLKQTFIFLGALSKNETIEKIYEVEGIWWDKTKVLPEKWLIKKRDYRILLDLKPNGVKNGLRLNLYATMKNGDRYEDYGFLQLVEDGNENHFKILPQELKDKKIFRTEDFEDLAQFAYEKDLKEYGSEVQVEK